VTRGVHPGHFPIELQHLLDELEKEGFEFTFGEVESDGGGIGFVAEKNQTEILVTDSTQTWFLTMRDPARPDVDDCWDLPRRVRGEVWEWLQDYGED
jgi:hypothetical protein